MLLWKQKRVRRVMSMTAQEAIRELQKVRNYCNATSIPAIDYAIEAILEKEDRASRES